MSFHHVDYKDFFTECKRNLNVKANAVDFKTFIAVNTFRKVKQASPWTN